jgi:Tripartite tricarboxylate transporter family receptor
MRVLPAGFVPPCLPTKAQEPPSGPMWLHEIKHDGFRVIARKDDKRMRGPPDIAARLLADKFTETWGKPVLVENATGAGGNVAVDRAAKAAPDGYTLVMASSAITINPSLRKSCPAIR